MVKIAYLLEVLGIVVLAASCTGPAVKQASDDREYRRLDDRLTAVERFELKQAACVKAGGALEVKRSAGRWAPRVTEMNRATCVLPPGAGY